MCIEFFLYWKKIQKKKKSNRKIVNEIESSSQKAVRTLKVNHFLISRENLNNMTSIIHIYERYNLIFFPSFTSEIFFFCVFYSNETTKKYWIEKHFECFTWYLAILDLNDSYITSYFNIKSIDFLFLFYISRTE